MEGKAAAESEFPVSARRFVWSHYPDCGFPGRVNHCAVLARNGKDSTSYMYSLGGFHATDEERVETLPDFGTGPIDILCMDIGEYILMYILCSCTAKFIHSLQQLVTG